MNKIYKLLIICLLLVVGGGDALNAQSVGDTFTKTYNEGEATAYTLTFKITKLTPKECSLTKGTNPSSATTLTIPTSVNGYSVTTIGFEAFRSCSGFTGSLTIPNSVTTIGFEAFFNCDGFNGSLTIGNSVTTIGEYAFSWCSGFTGSLTIGNSVTTIGNEAFYYCKGFTGSLTIPNSVTTIRNMAFFNCYGFNGSLTIGNSVTTIEKDAFAYCDGFTEVHSLAETAPTLGTGAFYKPNNATLYYPASSEQSYNNKGWFNYFSNNMGFNGKCSDNLYWYVDDTNTLTIFGTGTMYDYEYSGDNISPWRKLEKAPTTLFLEEGITHIGNYAFSGCSGFTRVYSSAEVAPTLGTDAFANINENATLYYPASSEPSYDEKGWFNYFSNNIGFNGKCGDNLFWNVDDTNTLTIFGTGKMYDYGYSDDNISPWRKLETAPTTLVLEEGITHIGTVAFYDCYGFTGSLTIPNSVTSIGNSAFYGCSGFTGSLTIPNSVTTIEESAFDGCSGFTGSLTIPNSVTTIGNAAFYGCSGFTGSLTIPNSVTSIGNSAFEGCSGFTEVYSSAEVAPTLGTNAFANINENATLYYPTSSEQSYIEKGWFNYFSKRIGLGKCGDNLFWNVDDTNTLTIFGTGKMYDYDYSGDNISPWRKLETAPTTLVMEEGITHIGNYAFYDCSGFTSSLTIPNSVTTIGNAAFYYCDGFTGSLTIGNSVTTIGKYAFYGCSGFTGSLTIPNSVTNIKNYAFSGCSGFTSSLTIPNSVTSIGESAFESCSDFNGSLTIGNSVTTIGNYAFAYCDGFNGSLTIGNSVTTIGNAAFYYCDGFTEVYSSAEVAPTLGTNAFANINENATLYYPDSSEPSYDEKGWFNYFSKRIGLGKCGDNLFWNVDDTNTLTIFGTGKMYDYDYSDDNISPWRKLETAPTTLVLEEGITHIGTGAFYDCYGFTGSLTIPNSVTNIGDWAFAYCSSFTGDLTIPNSVTTIGSYAFEGCSGFTGSLTIPNSITTIEASAFSFCSGFTGSLTIPNSVTTIGYYAFYGCSGFTGPLTIPNSVTSIGESAFDGCSGFTGSLTIPNSITTIENNTFSGCSGFTGSLTIPNSVTNIGNYAFYGCSGFTGSLTIPNSVTNIGDWAFAYCSSFTGDLTIPNSVTTIDESAFEGCSGFTGSLTIPNSVTTIGNYAFDGCSGFTRVYSSAEVAPTLGTDAFANINENATLYYPASSEPSYDEKGWFNYFSNNIGFNGKCGDNLYWYVDDENTLIIFGTGEMENYFSVLNIALTPWIGLNPAPTSLVLEEGITHIGNAAFLNEDFKGSLTIPNSVTSIGYYAFKKCSGFTGSLTIPNSATTIGDEAFRDCSGFTGSLTIPNSVTTIGDYAFENCDGLTNIFFYRDTRPTKTSHYAFNGISSTAKVYAPVIWESFDNFPSAKLVKMATFVGQQTTDNRQQSSSTGWVGLAEGQTWPDEDEHVAINASLVLGSQQNNKTTRQQGRDVTPVASEILKVKSFGLCGNENTTNGSITIEDGGQLYCEVARGEVTVKKEIVGYAETTRQQDNKTTSESVWYTIASPLKDTLLISDPQFLNSSVPQFLSSNSDLYRYDEPTHTWQNSKPGEGSTNFQTLDPGRGYLYANAENTTLEFTGNINTETVTYNLTAKSDVLNGFHLVGNPFTHNITFAHLNATEGAELVNGYYVLNGEGAWGATLGSNEDDVIKVGQGVLVKAKSEGTLAISRQPSAVSRQRSGKGQQTTDNGQQSLCISVSNAKYSDRAFVVFDKGVGLDKMNHENEDIPLLYIPMEDADYAIAMMDVNVNEIPVNFETNVMGQYTISLRQENCEFEELYLLDKETNTTVNILAEDYTFIATSSDSPERFILMKDNGQQTTDNRPWVYVNNGDIVIYDIEGDADIKIFDALGRCVYQGESSDETTRIANGYSAGVYMIQKVDDKGVNVQKIIL